MKKYAVIVAGGSGSRMGGPTPKQFLLLQGKTVLWHTLKVFLDAYEDMEIILVLPEAHLETGRRILATAEADASIREGVSFQDRLRSVRVVAGGDTRFRSAPNGIGYPRPQPPAPCVAGPGTTPPPGYWHQPPP